MVFENYVITVVFIINSILEKKILDKKLLNPNKMGLGMESL